MVTKNNVGDRMKKLVRSDGNGSLIVSKKVLLPLSLVIGIVMLTVGLMSYASGIEHQVEILKLHAGSDDVHQPFEKKLQTWYTRNEAEDLESEVKHLLTATEDIQRKVDVLIQRTTYLEER